MYTFGDSLGDYNHVNLETEIELVWRCTWRQYLSNCGDAFGAHEHVSLEAVIVQVWWRTSIP